jgi:hypothetical protein
MKFLTPIFLLLSITAPFVNANDSLYNPQEAVPVVQTPTLNFGPQASKFRYDKRMIRAAEIAERRARVHSASLCWRYVKKALLEAQVVGSYPSTGYAKQAGAELMNKYGFKPLKVKNPYQAPIGSVLVYGGRGAGHVEIRTDDGFVSDFASATPSPRPLIGVYVKPS